MSLVRDRRGVASAEGGDVSDRFDEEAHRLRCHLDSLDHATADADLAFALRETDRRAREDCRMPRAEEPTPYTLDLGLQPPPDFGVEPRLP
jgi:hypothetical protein